MSELLIGAAWREVRDRFRAAGIDTPELDARLLAELALGLDRLELVRREGEVVGKKALARLQEVADRRLRGEPVARIIGHKEFWGLNFALNAATLVPRPETEALVSRALELMAGQQGARLLDLGTGTGCIPIAVLAERADCTAVAVELSAQAAAAARTNAVRLGVADRLQVREGSWFEPLAASERFELVTSNPPYIEREAIGGLGREVRDFDPTAALDGGEDGLDGYREIVGMAFDRLVAGGALLVEIGSTQAAAVSALFRQAGFAGITVEKDLAGLDRLVWGHHL